MVFTMWYNDADGEASDECSVAEITALVEAGTITDETQVFVDGMAVRCSFLSLLKGLRAK